MGKSWLSCLSFILVSLSFSTSVAGQVLSNKKLTVSIGNQQSWTGRNGTGNLSYYGCDYSQDQCIYLTGGTVTCRNGICSTTWKNKNYTYVLSSPLTAANERGKPSSTLIVYSDSKVILETKLLPLPFDNINYSQ
ncbi:hypothetical protein NIES4102_27290 [Chondrocystis sp. NIES-4102]|nr:hypothetical protein NIES4102_27290 [Chondrocystis sp. NIES-4102]